MPWGGSRGGGRPTKAAAEAKAAALAEAIAKAPRIDPRALLQGIMNNPKSTTSEKLKACELFQKLPSDAAPTAPASAPPLTIFAVPRGAIFNPQTNALELPPDAVLETVKPFTTSPINATQTMKQREPIEEVMVEEAVPFEAAEPEPPKNVTRLRPGERIYGEGARFDPSRRLGAANPHNYKPRDG